MTSGITLRAYQPGDEVAINEGFNTVFALDRGLDEWAWKFRDRGAGRWIAVAVDESGRVQAHYSAIPVRLVLGDLAVWAGQVVDCFSLPGVRHTRVFADLYRVFIENFLRPDLAALLFGFPGRRHFELGRKLLEYAPLGPAPYLSRRVPRWPLGLTRSGFLTRENWQDEEGGELWGACRARCRCATVRDTEYLAWRYGERPGVEYHRVAVERHGRVHALAVARVLADRLRVADLLWDGEDPRAVRALSRALDSLARRMRCRTIDAWLGGDPVMHGLLVKEDWRMEPGPEDLMRVARTCHSGIDLDLLARHQFLTYGDSDLV